MKTNLQWAAFGALVALLLRREFESGSWTTAALFAVAGAAVGFGIAWLVRRGA
jgi:hypothetical protein